MTTIAILGIGWLTLQSASGKSQVLTATIDRRASCRVCDVRLTHITTLGSLEKVVGNTAYLPADAHHRYYVAVPEDRGRVTVYDRNGRIVRRIGRPGAGPGEFVGLLRPFVGPGNTMYVFDNGASRFTVFDTAGRRQREAPVPRGIQRVAFFSDGSFVTNGDFRTPSSIGYPLHYLSAGGRILRSFGTDNPMRAPGVDTRNVRRIAAVNDSLFWSVAESQYVLELWNAKTGRLIRRLRRNANWFPADAGRDDVTPSRPPKPFIQALQIDGLGRIWILALVADHQWKANITRRKSLPGEAVSYAMNYPRVWDTVIEVIDPANRALLVSKRIDPFVRGFSRTDQLFSFRENDSGVPLIDVWNVTFIEKEQAK